MLFKNILLGEKLSPLFWYILGSVASHFAGLAYLRIGLESLSCMNEEFVLFYFKFKKDFITPETDVYLYQSIIFLLLGGHQNCIGLLLNPTWQHERF